jgi:hypothetical protein
MISEALMNRYDKQEKRIIAILGTKKLDVTNFLCIHGHSRDL